MRKTPEVAIGTKVLVLIYRWERGWFGFLVHRNRVISHGKDHTQPQYFTPEIDTTFNFHNPSTPIKALAFSGETLKLRCASWWINETGDPIWGNLEFWSPLSLWHWHAIVGQDREGGGDWLAAKFWTTRLMEEQTNPLFSHKYRKCHKTVMGTRSYSTKKNYVVETKLCKKSSA